MGKDFSKHIASSNSFSFNKLGNKSKAVKVKPENIGQVVSIDIDEVANIKNSSEPQDNNLDQSIKSHESLEIIESLEEENNQLLNELSIQKDKIRTLEKSIFELKKQIKENKGDTKIINLDQKSIVNIDLSSNARKLLKCLTEICIDDQWTKISRKTILEEYNVHISYFGNSKLELKEKGFCDFKEDFIEGTKKKATFYKLNI